MEESAREEEWAALMRAALAGDAGTYRRFLQSITPYLRRLAQQSCARFGASASDAEDAVQEALLAIHLKRGTWDPARPITPWLSAIVRNKLIDMLRRAGQPAVPIDNLVEVLPAGEAGSAPEAGDIERLIGKLKDQQRSVVRMVSLEGCSAREAATRLGMSETGVRVALHRALKSLASLYEAGAGRAMANRARDPGGG
ncbi:sigma-70 family RNA polymerase sigma factor [Ancylobacter sp. MQZ15Z-1]|uniref:Sigma-70 family RNA polymerase sigma factor n=1 Tax=Ancylobacter mangrovi TaxID=2972472 RepID=A0A9X2T7U2_9HYPH|nr:sigma-70 family RNA polymerase sigma factor [Ancylobacter mangrovi]MCS0496448.1 sigma-70 family RNA polymerase sigma factor [Ancylobacter mangrovi]